MPNATTITVRETLEKLETDFRAVAGALENGEFALWVGSGISRKAPDLGALIVRTMEYLRVNSTNPVVGQRIGPAFFQALKLAEIEHADVIPYLDMPFGAWPNHELIRDRLWKKYSDLLDVRVQGEPEDHLLWVGMDIREAFANPAPPACAHLSIAVLILEGALHEIVSANWDGFIEAAVSQLTGGVGGALQVIVDPDQLRDPPAAARLLKFHGCIVYATDDPAHYRQFLIGSKTRILGWPEAATAAAMRNEMVSIATRHKAMMVGLSLQDVNLQSLFVKAREAKPWPWPPAPHAQGHVFCSNELGEGHRQILKTVYDASYNDHIQDIESSALLQAWGEQVLLAMALKVVTDKLLALMTPCLPAVLSPAETDRIGDSLKRVRDRLAAGADGDRTALMNAAITNWSRMVAIFRDGNIPADPKRYLPISGVSVANVANDENVRASGFGEMGIAIAMLELGENLGEWNLSAPGTGGLESGALSSTGTWSGAPPRPIFLVRSASIAIKLRQQGAFSNDNAIIIHADEAWGEMAVANGQQRSARSPSRAPGRTGPGGPTHVSLVEILRAGDLDGIHRRFMEAVTL